MATRGRPTTPRSARRAAVRDELLQAVTTALADGRSYADLGVNELVERAGIAKSTFYQYFTSKNGLLTSLLDEVGTTLGATDAWLDFERAPTAEQVEELVRERAARYLPYLPLMAAAFDAVYIDGEVRDTAQRVMAQLNAGIEAHIREGQAAGWIDASLPPRDTAVWLNWMLTRGFHQLILGADDGAAKPLIAEFSHLVWSILYAPSGDLRVGTVRASSNTN